MCTGRSSGRVSRAYYRVHGAVIQVVGLDWEHTLVHDFWKAFFVQISFSFSRDEIVKRVEKLQEPPAAKRTKALPTPIEAPKKRRGGRRVRKMKER